MASYEINLSVSADGSRRIELYGEFDLHNLHELASALRRAAGPLGPAAVDLSGVTFADVCALRELARARRYYPRLMFVSPSWQVTRGARALGLEDDLDPAPASLTQEAS